MFDGASSNTLQKNMPATNYFLQTEFEDWDLKKAFVIFLEKHSFPVAKKYMKEDIKKYITSPVIAKKAANKANTLLKQLDVSILRAILNAKPTSTLEGIGNPEKLEHIIASNY